MNSRLVRVATRVAIALGILAIFEVGLLVFPWIGEQNRMLLERYAPMPSGITWAAGSNDRDVEALSKRVQTLEKRIAEVEKQTAAQNSTIASLRAANQRDKALPGILPSFNSDPEVERPKWRVDALESREPTIDARRLRDCIEYSSILC